jgi:DNA-binding transcriptional LysR family regulator
MKISLEALQLMDAIDNRGSFSAAAESLNRVPSAVTHAVRKLEEAMDVELFQREGRRAQLTPAGRILLEEGRHLLRAAGMLENRVQRVARGWETELRIAVDGVIDLTVLMPLVAEFDQLQCGTRLRLGQEVLGGSWDALLTGRADLAIGAKGEPPPGSGLTVQAWGQVNFVLAVAPHHPLAAMPDPISAEEIARHRVIAIADTSRELAARSMGLLTGPTTLTVPTLEAKAAAQMAGLGIGHLPRFRVEKEIAEGRLVVKQETGGMLPSQLQLAWHAGPTGKALDWFRQRLADDVWRRKLLPDSL